MKRKKRSDKKVGRRSWRRREKEGRRGVRKRGMGKRKSSGFKPQLCPGMVGKGTDRAWAGPKVDPDRPFVQCVWGE